MIKKINEYVDYIFRLNNLNDNDLKDEIKGNLISRYENLLKEGLTEDKAYIETIKAIGDFNLSDKNIDEKYTYKANWANISMIVSLALAVIAIISLFINLAVNLVLFSISISLYVGSSYYLYHQSQHAMKIEKDVLKHNELLKSIFTYLKTVFSFWNINISYLLSIIISDNIVYSIMAASIDSVSGEYLTTLIVIKVVLFIVFFAIFFLISKKIFEKLENKYFDLTKENKLDSLIKKNKIFNIKPSTVKKILKGLMISFLIICTLFTMFDQFTIRIEGISRVYLVAASVFTKLPDGFIYNLISIIAYVFFGISLISFIIYIIKNSLIGFVISYISLFLTKIFDYIFVSNEASRLYLAFNSHDVSNKLVLSGIVFVILLFFAIKNNRKKI